MNNDTIILKDRAMLPVNGGFIEVSMFDNSKKLSKGRGYIKDNIIYIYRGKAKDKNFVPASIYKIEGGKYRFVEPSPIELEEYSLDKIVTLNKDIIKECNDDSFVKIDPKLLELNEGDYFAPDTKDGDDILKRIIKRVLRKRQINIRVLRDKFSTDYEMNNMKSALVKEGNMSIKYFQKWCEILEIDIHISAWDISDKQAIGENHTFDEPLVEILSQSPVKE